MTWNEIEYMRFEESRALSQEAERIDHKSLRVFERYFGMTGLTWERVERLLFKYTDCGVSFYHPGPGKGQPGEIHITGYCEGTDRTDGLPTYTLRWPYTVRQIREAVENADRDGCDLWNETHGCEQCGEPDEFGDRVVRKDCQSCGGTGVVI